MRGFLFIFASEDMPIAVTVYEHSIYEDHYASQVASELLTLGLCDWIRREIFNKWFIIIRFQ